MLEKLFAAGAYQCSAAIDYNGVNLGRVHDGEFIPSPHAAELIEQLLGPAPAAPAGTATKRVGRPKKAAVVPDPDEADDLSSLLADDE